jgi:hypothetical protein
MNAASGTNLFGVSIAIGISPPEFPLSTDKISDLRLWRICCR